PAPSTPYSLSLHDALPILGLLLLSRDGGVSRNHDRHHTAQGFDPQRERGHVEQNHVLHIAREDPPLNRRTDRHDLIGVHAAVRLDRKSTRLNSSHVKISYA